MRIRQRLALLGTVLATGTVLLFAALLYLLATGSTQRDQDTALAGLAATAAADYRPTGEQPALTIDAATSLDAFIMVTDASGDVVYSQARIDGALPTVPAQLRTAVAATGTARLTTASDGVELRMSARPLGEDAAGGLVVAAQQTAFMRSQLQGLTAATVIAAVFTAIAGAVASWVVSGRALRPLRDLAGTAGEIARTGDVTRRLPVAKGRDEVAGLSREFNAMMDRLHGSQAWLAASLEQQRRFVADASHELRTPLTTIRNNAGFLLRRPDAAAADRAEALGDLRADADRMAVLVEELLVLARADALPDPIREPVDILALAAEVCRMDGARLVRSPDGPAGPCVVLGDESLLRRLLRCLVDNGRAHGGGTVWVRVGGAAPSWVVVTVWDEGPGFPTESLAHVFDRFYRADPARSGPGSGLGLAIAQSVARAHGGAVHATNGAHGGAVLTVHLPVATVDNEADADSHR